MAEELLQVKGMHKHFGITVSLNDVSFVVERGYVYALIGENEKYQRLVAKTINHLGLILFKELSKK